MTTIVENDESISFTQRFGRFLLPLGMVAIMWIIQLFNIGGWMNRSLGLVSRDVGSLWNIFTFPFVHAGWWHISANSVPLLVLGCIVAMSGSRAFIQATALIITMGGALLWLFGPSNTLTVGASGLIFGYMTYLIARAIFYPSSFKKIWYIAVAIGVGFFYSATFFTGVIPHVGSGISWQAHLFGAVAGVITAWIMGNFAEIGKEHESSTDELQDLTKV
ncbi:MAG: rhomboid family intramembrane serine protease [Micrococcaceae bacterium]